MSQVLDPNLSRDIQRDRARFIVATKSRHKVVSRHHQAVFLIASGKVCVRAGDVLKKMVAPLIIARALRHLHVANGFGASIVRQIRNQARLGFAPAISVRQYNALLRMGLRERAA